MAAIKLVAPKSEEGEGSGAYIRRLLQMNKFTDDQILQLVHKNFSGSKAKKSDINWNRNRLAKEMTEQQADLVHEEVELELEEEQEPDTSETDEQISARILKRFNALDRMATSVIKGVVPSLIVSGPAGLGKSYGVEQALKAEKNANPDFKYDRISGSITAVGLYIALWNMREGGVVVIDDADSVFRDEETLNILKAALDSGKKRTISWRKQSNWLDEMGIDDQFDYEGRVIFLTNIDFERQVQSGKALAVHFKALMDRSLYLHLAMRTARDAVIRIRQIAPTMLKDDGLDAKQAEELLAFVEENKVRFYYLSLRLIHQIALCVLADPENWKDDVEMTKMRNV